MKRFIYLFPCLIGGLLSCTFTNKPVSQSIRINYPEPIPDKTGITFLPDIVSKEGLDFNATFSRDGKTFYFSRSDKRKYIIYESKFGGKQWEEPVPSSLFDTVYSNTDPFITPDGSIYFISNRPKDNSDKINDYDIYRLGKQNGKWAEPEYLKEINSDSTEYYVSVSDNGNIYFASYRDGNLDLYMSKKSGHHFKKPETLGTIINSGFDEHDPFIAPDESFLIFTSNRPGNMGEADLYIAHRKNNQWQEPVNMGDRINTITYDYCPNVSPDGKYFFYSSERDVKWINAEFLKNYGSNN